jgi:hypothetical protein
VAILHLQYGLPFIASHLSRRISGSKRQAATGAAHCTPQIALRQDPTKQAVESGEAQLLRKKFDRAIATEG